MMKEILSQTASQQKGTTQPQQVIYVALPFRDHMSRWDGLRSLVVAQQSHPTQPCGHAHHIGSSEDLALYRLKIRGTPERKGTLALEGIFVLQEGAFRRFA